MLNPPEMPAYVDDRDIAARSLGAFFAWIRPNDGLCVVKTSDGKKKLRDISITHCCAANGARTLYYVWDSIVTKAGDATRVNLLLNRASPWLDVASFLPVEGRVVLQNKVDQQVIVRMPEWVDLSAVKTSSDRRDITPRCTGRELDLGRLETGTTVTLSFPVPEKTVWRNIFSAPYKLTMRGSNVVAIEPPGEACPLYENQPTGRLVTKSRFIPSKRVIW